MKKLFTLFVGLFFVFAASAQDTNQRPEALPNLVKLLSTMDVDLVDDEATFRTEELLSFKYTVIKNDVVITKKLSRNDDWTDFWDTADLLPNGSKLYIEQIKLKGPEGMVVNAESLKFVAN